MESLFDKDPTQGPPPSNLDRIASEIAHLKKSSSVRYAPGQARKMFGAWVLTFFIIALLGLYFMDPFLYALKKTDAINTYLYLHAYDGASATNALLATKIFSEYEIAALNRRQGSFQGNFSTLQQAEAKAASIVSFMDGLNNLHENKYDKLDTLGKIRCVLFVRNGLMPPTSWDVINPQIQ